MVSSTNCAVASVGSTYTSVTNMRWNAALAGTANSDVAVAAAKKRGVNLIRRR
jgi:hypothetical protein